MSDSNKSEDYWPAKLGSGILVKLDAHRERARMVNKKYKSRSDNMPSVSEHTLSSKAEGKALGQAGGKAGPDKGPGKWKKQPKATSTAQATSTAAPQAQATPTPAPQPKKEYFTVGSTESAPPFVKEQIIKLGSQKRQMEGEAGAVIGQSSRSTGSRRTSGGIKDEMGGRGRSRSRR